MGVHWATGENLLPALFWGEGKKIMMINDITYIVGENYEFSERHRSYRW